MALDDISGIFQKDTSLVKGIVDGKLNQWSSKALPVVDLECSFSDDSLKNPIIREEKMTK